MKAKLIDAPLAQLSDGTLVVSVTHIENDTLDIHAATEAAIKAGRRIFIGVELTRAEAKKAWRQIDQVVAEVVATTYRDRG